MELIIDANDYNPIDSDYAEDSENSELSDQNLFEQKNICFYISQSILKIKHTIMSCFCRRNEEFLTVGERLLQGYWFPGFNIALFYICLFFGFCAIVNFFVDPNDPCWIYTLFFFAFFISSILG